MGIFKGIKDKIKGTTLDYTEIAQILPKGEYVFKVYTKDGKFFYKNCKQYDMYYNTFIKYVKEDK